MLRLFGRECLTVEVTCSSQEAIERLTRLSSKPKGCHLCHPAFKAYVNSTKLSPETIRLEVIRLGMSNGLSPKFVGRFESTKNSLVLRGYYRLNLALWTWLIFFAVFGGAILLPSWIQILRWLLQGRESELVLAVPLEIATVFPSMMFGLVALSTWAGEVDKRFLTRKLRATLGK